MIFIKNFFIYLVVFEIVLIKTSFAATAAQLYYIGPVLTFGMFCGAPLAAAILTLSDK